MNLCSPYSRGLSDLYALKTTDLCFARYCSLGSMAPAKLDWIMRINEQDREKIQGWNSELCQIYHEENEEKAQEKKKREQIQP